MKATMKMINRHKFWYLINIVLTILFIAPLIWTLSTALKFDRDIIALPPEWIPPAFNFGNFMEIWNTNNHIFTKYFMNSVITTIFAVVLNVIVSSLAAYGLAKLKIPCKKLLLVLIFAAIMVPFQSLLIPLYEMMNSMGLLNSYLSLVVIYVTFHMPIAVYIMINMFEVIPESLRESAQLDGAGEFKTFFKIMLPLCWPGLATIAIYTAYTTWNDYIVSLVFMQDESLKTLNVGLTNMAIGIYGNDWGLLTSGAIVSLIPMIFLFIFLQRYFISGLTGGSVK
ncbi:carbohydrate ABC transporter permease [Bacillus sp. UMB0899]|nr:carbohydrate ABC transporter permease [Bacillus sp. UMB0899]